MASIPEILNSIKAYGEVAGSTNPIREFAWVLNQVVQEDLAQVRQISGDTSNFDLLTQSLLYGQRMMEIGYIFTEVFIRDEYRSWQPKSDYPRVIDLGGDPGAFSILYWKYRAPSARITVVEANPVTANVMRRNLTRRGLEDVQIINAAVAGDADGNAILHLHRPGNGWHTQDYVKTQSTMDHSNEYAVEVPKILLSTLIGEKEQIDLLKVDIEGLEVDAIRELAQSGKLKQVNQIIMEFHHSHTLWPDNSLLVMLKLLDESGFFIEEAHITVGEGMRRKIDLPIQAIPSIASSDDKVYLTFNALKRP